MKDNSKANWPVMMAEQNKNTALMGGEQVWYVKTPLNIMLSICAIEAEARARQICALPRMVNLLKIMCNEKLSLKTPQGEVATDLYTPNALEARNILIDIGEIEGGE